ncbi:MAG: hypothetical protein SVV67_08790 [Bacillota bacterium]|nr:hypothetical protein [Bacillota bacterium]
MDKYEVALRGPLGQSNKVTVEADGIDTGGGFVGFRGSDGLFVAMFAATDVISVIKVVDWEDEDVCLEGNEESLAFYKTEGGKE